MEFGDEIIKILNYLGEKIGVTIDWTSENVLPYVEELCVKYVTWEISTSTAWIGITIAALVIILIACIIFHILVKKDIVDEEIEFWAWIVFICAIILAFIIIGVQVFDIIECRTFPEKAIYDYIKVKIGSGTTR